MHPILKDINKLVWYMSAWLVAGAFIAVILAVAEFAHWPHAFYFALPVTLIYGFFASSAYYVCRARPFAGRQSLMALVVFGGAALVSGFVWLLICRVWNSAGAGIGFEFGLGVGQHDGLIVISQHLEVLLYAIGFGLYVVSILAHDVLIAFENMREAEKRQAQSDLLARDAELQLLRTQINPHFLFNSLNSISALTTIDPQAARQMTIELAQFFRLTMALSEKRAIPLSEELALCQSFLAIEKIRFGKKLHTGFDIADAAQQYMIPPMLLQPLVENAIKHGIRDLVAGGTIQIKGELRGASLHLSVQNPVDAEPTASDGNGLGLKNIRQRIASIYGGAGRVSWARTDGYFLVELVLPLMLDASA